MDSFEQTWSRIQRHAGQIFYQKSGGEFRYKVVHDCVVPGRTNLA